MNQIYQNQRVSFGTDPEGFFENSKGLIMGSELVIPDNLKGAKWSEIVQDGVQLEIHVPASVTRQGTGEGLINAFRSLQEHLKNFEGVKMSFKGVVTVSKGEMAKLSDTSRILGCAPSLNVYDPDATINVDRETYRVRAAGGHIHMGLPIGMREVVPNIVLGCDALAGNTAVLMDRDPLQKTRRQVYGRAGEYRIQTYGMEYRTLSNFWLRAYPLWSLMSAQCLNAVQLVSTSQGIGLHIGQPKWRAEKTLYDLVDPQQFRKAIDNNDYDLARKNFEGVIKFLSECTGITQGLFKENIDDFLFFIDKIDKDGLEYWFDADPVKHWTQGTLVDWEDFVLKVIRPKREAK